MSRHHTEEDEEEDIFLTQSSIREKFRKQKRQEAMQKSFREVRQKIIEQAKEQKKKKDLPNVNPFLNGIQQAQQPQIRRPIQPVQPQQPKNHENLCFNLNIGNVNFHKNDQNFCANNKQQPNYYPLPPMIPQNQQPFQQHQLININNFIQPFLNQYPNQYQIPHNSQIINNTQIMYKKLHQIPKQQKRILLKYKNYLVYDDIIGTGTYSKVYLGLDINTNTKVAIKQISQLQQNQIKVLMSIQSPYIIKLQSSWKNNTTNLTYLVLDLCQRNLRQQIKKGISFQQKLQYFNHVIHGIETLFSKNIIHRDLKFQNILVTKQKIGKITDFGLAKDLGIMSNVASLRCGTPYTMAPQIFFHHGYSRPYYSQKCDIWSLGIILHEMIYNKHPFNYQSQRMMKMQRVYVQKKYGYLDIIIDRSLVKDPQKRITWNQFKKIYQSKGGINNKIKEIYNQSTVYGHGHGHGNRNGKNFKKKQKVQMLPQRANRAITRNNQINNRMQQQHPAPILFQARDQPKIEQIKILQNIQREHPKKQQPQKQVQQLVFIQKQKQIEKQRQKQKQPTRLYKQIDKIISNLDIPQATKHLKAPSFDPMQPKFNPKQKLNKSYEYSSKNHKNHNKNIKLIGRQLINKNIPKTPQKQKPINKSFTQFSNRSNSKRHIQSLVPADIFKSPSTNQIKEVEIGGSVQRNNNMKKKNNISQIALMSMFVAVFMMIVSMITSKEF